MVSYLFTFLVMISFWFIFSGVFTPLIVILAIVSGLIVTFLSNDLFFPDKKVNLKLIIKIFMYVPWLFWQIVLANIQVLKILLRKDLDIDPSMIEFDPKVESDIGLVIFANSITLTPGTVTIFADKNRFFVHTLDPIFADGLDGGEMQSRILEIEKCL